MNQLSPHRRLELRDRWLRLEIDGATFDFHHIWLRHNVDEDRHPLTRERTVDSSDLCENVSLVEARLDGEHLAVRFSDGLASRFAIAWLVEHAYARDRDAPATPPSHIASIEVHRGNCAIDDIAAHATVRARRDGAVVVRAGNDTSSSQAEAETERLVDAFARHGFELVATHFGRIEDLRPDNTTNENTDQLGYTDAAIDVHTDQPFIARPPRYQILQAIEPAASGGDSFLVDAFAAARYLRDADAEAYRLLTTVPVRFHRKQRAFESIHVGPILDPVAPHGGFQVRFSSFTMAPHKLPFDQMEPWYRAYNRFARLVRAPSNQFRLRLGRGDFVIYDNYRMLHGRTGFQGRRWLRGIYLNEKPAA